MNRARWMCNAVLCAALAGGGAACGQGFGGAPPWGPEKPAHVQGEVRARQSPEYAIGGGLYLKLRPDGPDWEIAIGPPKSSDDYSACATPPFHGPNPRQLMAWHFQPDHEGAPGGVGQKRWIEFTLTAADDAQECRSLEPLLRGESSAWGEHVSGRCWFTPLKVQLSAGEPPKQTIESLEFEAECAPHGNMELWRLPAVYRLPKGFTGWVTVYYLEKDARELPRESDHYVAAVGRAAVVHTSSVLRQDAAGAKFVLEDGAPLPVEGLGGMIWGWQSGDAHLCAPYQTFFAGTIEQYHRSMSNPLLDAPRFDCAKLRSLE